MPTGRNRTKYDMSGMSGSICFKGNPGSSDTVFPQNMTVVSQARNIDVTGNPHGDNNFSLWRDSKAVQPLVGPSRGEVGANAAYVTGSPVPFYFEGGGMDDYYFWPGMSNTSVLGNKLLARTNPSRPVVDLPVFLFELKDLPGMLKQAGDALHWIHKGVNSRSGVPKPTARGMADANLAYQFGWAPFVSDVRKLLDFTGAVEKKKAQLSRLYSKGGLRSTVTLGEESRSSESLMTVQSYGCTIVASRRRSGKTKTWGSVRWRPTIDLGAGSSPTDWAAVQAAFGLDITLSTIWEALPWSWLVDWFTDMGDILAAHRNTIPAAPERMCIMYTESTETVYTTHSATPGWSWGGATTRNEYKSRAANINPGILPTGYIPFLGDSQLSILGSLAITRGNRG